MAKSNAYLISILIIISSLSSPSQGLTIAGYTINQVIIDDVVYCRFNGTPNPVSNATVYLTCGGSTTRLVEVLTDTYGILCSCRTRKRPLRPTNDAQHRQERYHNYRLLYRQPNFRIIFLHGKGTFMQYNIVIEALFDSNGHIFLPTFEALRREISVFRASASRSLRVSKGGSTILE
ncbi:hypothetical protein HID58_065965 [Brassica napus]|uniref:S-protein homolog n=1 Tax=Brassica napus TaxID=3708 RepID=A0ABQ7ZES7_BRANA|nr:hypothetical protein HID58_065965 [Brassica napus]